MEGQYDVVPTTDSRWKGKWRVVDARGDRPRIVVADSPFEVNDACLAATGKAPYSYVPVIEREP